jgi:hypothetical protein
MAKALILKITLKSLKSKVWRRIAIPEFTTYAQLHEIIQIAFEWQNAHLYGFFPSWRRNLTYSASDHASHDPFSEDAAKFNIESDLQKGTIAYIYDFGVNWIHQIKLEEASDDATSLPRITGGRGEGDWDGLDAEFGADIGDEDHPIDAYFPKAELNEALAKWGQSQAFEEIKQVELPQFNLASLDWRGLQAELPNLKVNSALGSWAEPWAELLDEFSISAEHARVQQYPVTTQKLILANLYIAVKAQTHHEPEQFNIDDWVRGLRSCAESVEQVQPRMTAMVVAVQSMFILLACKPLSFQIFAKMDDFEKGIEQEQHPQPNSDNIIKFPGKQS